MSCILFLSVRSVLSLHRILGPHCWAWPIITVEGTEIFADRFLLLSRSLICCNVLDFSVEQLPWFRILEEAIMFAASHRTRSLIIVFAGDFGWTVSRMWRNPHNFRSFYDYFFNPPSSPLYSKRPIPSRISIKFSHTFLVSCKGIRCCIKCALWAKLLIKDYYTRLTE